MATDAESLYLNKISGVYNGCLFNCNPYIKEYNYIYPHHDSSLSGAILALPGILLKISVEDLKIVYDLFLLSTLYFLVYLLVFRLTGNTLISIFGSSVTVLGFNIVNVNQLINLPDIYDLLRLKTDYTQFLIFSRPINPQFSSVYLFIYLHVLLSAVQNKTKKWFYILAIIYGFSFYIYFFTYAFVTVIQGLWMGLCLVRKEYKTLLDFTISTVVGLLLAIPVFIQVYTLLDHPFYHTIPTDYLVKTHIPDISLIGAILLIVFMAISFIYRKMYKTFDSNAYFIFILVLSCFVARNEHVLSGMVMQYNHFESYLFTPVFVIAICFFLYSFINRETIYKSRVIFGALIFMMFFNAVIIQYKSYKHWLSYSTFAQNYVPALDFIRDKLPKESIISAPELISSIIPFYTSNYVMWSLYAGQWISVPGRIEDAVRSRNSTRDLLEVGKKYKVDYFVEDKKGNLLKNTELEKLYEDEIFVVYKANY